MKNEDLYVYKKSDFYEDFISSQKEYYEREQVDALLAEKDREIAKLKEKLMPCLNGDCILTCEVVEKYGKENAELKAENERLKAIRKVHVEAIASMEAGLHQDDKEIRRLKRALWLERARRAEARKNYWYARSCHEGDDFLVSIDGSPVKYIGCIKRTNYDWLLTWSEVERKCRAKAEEYK